MKRYLKKAVVMAVMIATMLVSVVPAQAASNIYFSGMKASNITTNSARVDVTTVNPNRNTVSQVGFQIRKQGARSWNVKVDNVTGSYRNSSSLKSWFTIGSGKEVNMALSGGTVYEYQVFCKVGNTKYYSAIQKFKTNSVYTAPKQTAVNVKGLSFSTFKLSGQVGGVRVDFKTVNPSRLSISNVGIQVRRRGTSAWVTKTDTVSYGYRTSAQLSSWFIIGSGKEVNMALYNNTEYEYRAFCKTNGITYYSGIKTFRVTYSSSANTSSNSGRQIYGNGIGGITININAAPYSTKQSGIAYSSVGCTWFAACRGQQLTGRSLVIYGPTQWYNTAYSYYGFTRGKTIRGKAFACYANHILVIEKVVGNDVYISEGGCNGWGASAKSGYCRIAKVSKNDIEKGLTQYNGAFLGYVYL